jgi:hypothetical protein
VAVRTAKFWISQNLPVARFAGQAQMPSTWKELAETCAASHYWQRVEYQQSA